MLLQLLTTYREVTRVEKVWLSTRYFLDPAVTGLSGNAERLFTRGIAYCGLAETGGFIARSALTSVLNVRSVERLADELVAANLWTVEGTGWRLRSWSEWNDAHDALAQRRRSDRERQARLRDEKRRLSEEESRDTSRDDLPPVTRLSRDVSRDVTALDREREKEEMSTTYSSPGKSDRADVERICQHLAERVEANGSKRPKVTDRWRDAARLMLDRDGRTEDQVHTAIDWCQGNEFWRANVLSLPTLREKYDQLRLQAQRQPSGGATRSTTDDRVSGALAIAAHYEERGE